MRNILLCLQFRGTNYHGYQVQKNALAVATPIQDAIEAVIGKREDIKGCSRTDSGVHAREYVLNFQTEREIPCRGLKIALNQRLPDDIVVTRCEEVPLSFHARYSARGKEYIYQINNGAQRDPFGVDLSYFYPYPLDEEMLGREAQDFVGTHDFKAFCSAGSDIEDTVRTVTYAAVERKGDMLYFTVRGDGFLYNMVRIMVGTLLRIAQGKIGQGEIPAIIASKDRGRAGLTAPAHGLYLNRVFYDAEAFQKEDEHV